MLPRIIFKNLHTVMAILALFKQFLGKFCLNFLPLNLRVSPNMMHLVRTFSIMCAQSVRLIVIKKVPNHGKTVFIKNMFENGWWGRCIPHFPPGSAPARTDNNVFYRYTNQLIWFYHDMRQILSRTALAQFGHFTLKTKARFEKGGGGRIDPPLGAPLVETDG